MLHPPPAEGQGNRRPSMSQLGVLPDGLSQELPGVQQLTHLYAVEFTSPSGKTVYYKVGKTGNVHERMRDIRSKATEK
eukprot:8395272-Karenia_brevis.AAC.1